MAEASPLAELVERLRQGDAEAAQQLVARYAQRLCRLAEQQLSRRVAARVGSEDVVQSVFRTFCRRCARGEFQIDSSLDLWRLLMKITLRKAQAKGRHHTRPIRDVRVEVAGGSEAWLAEAVTREPDPAEALALVDQVEALLQGLPPLYGQVLQMRLENYAVAEIAPQLGVSRQTVYRMLTLLQRRLRASIPGDAE
jgi:RNA polymerase sigma factor (sigma-70 family)